MKLYIIGPISGMPNNNEFSFRSAATVLTEAGYECVIPHDFICSDTPWDLALSRSISKMTTTQRDIYEYEREFDGIAMIYGWEKSKGARIEFNIACELGYPCKTLTEWLGEMQQRCNDGFGTPSCEEQNAQAAHQKPTTPKE